MKVSALLLALCSILVSAKESINDKELSLELLEYLAEFSDDNGDMTDPMTLEKINIKKQNPCNTNITLAVTDAQEENSSNTKSATNTECSSKTEKSALNNETNSKTTSKSDEELMSHENS